MAGIQQICPSCFSTRVRVRIGGGFYSEDGICRIPDDFGEIFHCPDCEFKGAGILEGNSRLVDFLHLKKHELRKESSRKQARASEIIVSKPLAVLDVQAREL